MLEVMSHGRRIPKELVNDQDLSRFTGRLLKAYPAILISSFFSLHWESSQKKILKFEEDVIRHEDNPEFNDLRFEEYPLDGKPTSMVSIIWIALWRLLTGQAPWWTSIVRWRIGIAIESWSTTRTKADRVFNGRSMNPSTRSRRTQCQSQSPLNWKITASNSAIRKASLTILD